MPQVYPDRSKIIFITYGETDESQNSAIWLYQRLKYSYLPVWTELADAPIGGGGFTTNSIAASSPLIAVFHGKDDNKWVKDHIQMAIQMKKEVILFFFEWTDDIPDEFRGKHRFFLAKSREDLEEQYLLLKADLMPREYPAPGRLWIPNGDASLGGARSLLQSDYDHMGIQFPVKQSYVRVFADVYNSHAKKEALRDLGNLKILRGLVIAALQDDPHESVRCEAALALSKIGASDWTRFSEASHYLFEATKQSAFEFPVDLYAKFGLTFMSKPQIIDQVIKDVSEVYEENDVNAARAINTSFGIHEPVNDRSIDEHQIFISYRRNDAEVLAVNLAEKLNNAGYPTWIDTKLDPGTPVWMDAVEKAIRKSTVVICLLSPTVSDSVWMKREIDLAERLEKTIIPIRAKRLLPDQITIQFTTQQGLRGDPVLEENPQVVLDLLVETLRKKNILPVEDVRG